jgi:hypothetical protein
MEVKMNILGKYGDGNVKLRQSVNMISQYTVYQPLISLPTPLSFQQRKYFYLLECIPAAYYLFIVLKKLTSRKRGRS